MLETIREYGLEQLAANGEAESQARRHAEYFRALSEEAENGLAGPDWRSWRLRLNAERENLRAALDWALAWGESDVALDLVGSLWRWFRPDAIAEGRRWIQQALALPGAALSDELEAPAPLEQPSAPSGLTPRELEVLHLLVAGQSNPEIAKALVISVKTVERHLANVYAKIGASSRVDAATFAVTHGLST